MKYLVFSDLHGSLQGLQLLKEAVDFEKPDVLLCLGDVLFGAYDGDARAVASYLSQESPTVIGVRGNCDHLYDEHVLGFALPEENTLVYHGHRLIMRHAPFYVPTNPGDVLLYGHTHVKLLHKDAGAYHLNPGSIGKPRDGSPSYATIEETGIFLKNASTHALISHEEF